ncbi:AzlC family ABC transporter permease [Tropicimonas sp. TH_r6]|uniref:AzlC family ABC transporter permease n=1 Tax=Tropicimonas sp. TH_r6 TaxID=3082085 RepID=UPI002955D9A4|nr:AzlC family ABC transporter permease [Tropicimonas sp. TH_r6]MDV7142784.1 AzlC family ABC transporter permease [Tropicimonas sp. TH_r6]
MKQGALSFLPLALGVAIYGFAFGILAAQVGFPFWGVAMMSASVHAGSSQIVAVEQFSGGGALVGAALAGALLNLRYIGIVASLTEILRHAPLPIRLLAIHITGDENWALTMSENARDKTIGAAFLIGSGLVSITTWTVFTTLGALVGSALPDLERFGLGFAFTAAFIAMARGMFRGRGDLLPWIGSFALTVALVLAGMAKAYAIVFGAVVGVTLSALQRRIRS